MASAPRLPGCIGALSIFGVVAAAAAAARNN
jgi:hypothetical protein